MKIESQMSLLTANIIMLKADIATKNYECDIKKMMDRFYMWSKRFQSFADLLQEIIDGQDTCTVCKQQKMTTIQINNHEISFICNDCQQLLQLTDSEISKNDESVDNHSDQDSLTTELDD